MNSKKQNSKRLKKPSKRIRAKSSVRTGNRSKQATNRKATSSNKTKKSKQEYVLGDAHEDFIFERRAKNLSYRKIAVQLVEAEEFPEIKSVHHTTVFDFFKNRYGNYKNVFLPDLKQVRSANAKCRLYELEEMKDKLKEKIFEMMNYEPRLWEDLNLAALIKQHRELLAQIQDESGDKVHKFKGEGFTGDLIWGDKTINVFADKTVQARAEETPDLGDRFKASRFSDPGDIISDN